MSNVSRLQGPGYRRHKPTGQAVVTLNGRDIYLGKYGSAASKEAYRRLKAEWTKTGGERSCDRQQEITVVEVVNAYRRFAKDYYRKNGKPTREYELIREIAGFIVPLYGRARAVEFGPLAMKCVRDQMVARGHCRSHINKNIARIKRMFKWAAAEELIPASIPQALFMVVGLRKGRCAAKETKPIMPVEDAAVDAALEHLPEVPADMVRLQRLTGMRPEEVCMLRPVDLDRSEDVWRYRPESHKMQHLGRERVIYVGPQAQAILLRYLARDAAAHCFRPVDSEAKRRAEQHANRTTPMSCGNVPGSNCKRKPSRRAGEKYTTDSYRRAIHRACDKAGIPRWSPNRLRHSAATSVRRQFGLEASQVILGHKTADVTQIYAERDAAKGVEVARMIG